MKEKSAWKASLFVVQKNGCKQNDMLFFSKYRVAVFAIMV
jgi:hypothetical protein